jgi:subtilase family serine protease
MQMKRVLAVAASAATVGALGAAVGGSASSGRPAAASAAAALAQVQVRPDVIRLRGWHAGPLTAPPTTAQCLKQLKIPCYSPLQLQQAYGLPKLYAQGTDGAGQTIVIVDSFGSPTIRHDLGVFDQAYGLPAPPSFKIIQPVGKVPPYKINALRPNWAGETTLDVEYSHAMAPAANILLVETPNAETEGTGGFPKIVQAEEYVIHHHLGDVISQSFAATEQSFPSAQSLIALRTPYKEAAAAGITVLAGTGDGGVANVNRQQSANFPYRTVNWPASDPLVTALGGTELHLNGAGDHSAPDTVWNDTYSPSAQLAFTGTTGPNPLAEGAGKSVVFSRPSYQNGVASVVGLRRSLPDLSMSAACRGAVLSYASFGGLPAPGFYPVCGTSEASPLFAGIVALATQVAGHLLGPINPALYAMSAANDAGVVDVTSGNNSVSFVQNGQRTNIHGFTAGPGFDVASGVGTIYGPDFVPELAKLAG